MELVKIMGKEVGYNPELKAEFASEAKSFLRAIKKELGLKEVKIDYNPGGIAVSGDATLIGMYEDGRGVYVTVSTPSYHGIMFRTVTHMKDWTGGTNQWLKLSEFQSYKEIAKHIKENTYDKACRH
jgi:hypothetical protein